VSDQLLPVFLKLAGRKAVLVGAGRVASAKLPALLAAGAEVSVVAPAISPAIAAAPVAVFRRPFVPADLDGAWVAVAAATPEVNREVAAAAEERRIFVNAVDDPANASAYTGGVLRRGGVTIAVSTEGRAPALAGLLREGLEAVVPDEIETWVRAAEWLKERQRAEGVPMGERRPRLLEALNALYARKLDGNKLERSGIDSRAASGGLGDAPQRPPAQ
jgi:siroheme synthase-like protein